MDRARHHWEILQKVPEELVRKVRTFMVMGRNGDGVMLVTGSGNGYWLGKMEFDEVSKEAMEPTRLDVPNLASIAHGYNHILLLDERGQIHAMGQNKYGQLGLGTVDQETRFSPQLISIPHKCISIRCGVRHSLALTEDGKVWAWGLNNFGQMGVPSSTANPQPSPRQIPELNPHRVVAIECGGCHSLALTKLGEVYVWGENRFGQLGNENESSTHTPTRIPTSSPIRSIAAGNSHTLLLTQTEEVYACGWNKWGQLGLPTTTKSSASLTKVAGLPSISQIASHFYASFSIAMSADQRCFVWGCLDNTFGTTLGYTTTSIPFQLPPIYSTLDSALSFRLSPHNTPCSVRVEGLECPQRTNSETQTEFLTRPIRLGERIVQMFDNLDSNPDVKFELGDQSILAHRSVLQISSAYFDQFFSESSSSAILNPPTPILQSSSNPLRHTTNQSEPNSQITSLPSNNPQTPLITIPIPNPDLKFELGDQSILAHRSVLQIFSAYFDRFFTESSSSANPNLPTPIPQSSLDSLRHTTNLSEPNFQITTPLSNHSQTPLITIPIPHHAYPVFHAYIHYLYTGTFQVSTESLPDLFELAHSHLESDLEQLCFVRMRSTLSPETSCLYYQLTERHPALSEFQQDLLQFIADNLLKVFLTDAYKSIDPDLGRKLTISVANLRSENP